MGKLETKIRNDKIFIAGHNGMVGSAVLRKLQYEGFQNLQYIDRNILDLTNGNSVKEFFKDNRPEIVILAAAKVGGIQANIDNPVSFLLENLEIQNNVIKHSAENGVKRFIFLSSSCIYPRECRQPMQEGDIMTGKLEPTNEGYALAKIVGMKLLEAYSREKNLSSLTLIPCNLYGPNDSFDLSKSHVLSALIKRFIDARDDNCERVTLWGSGQARREFMHVDDIANAVFFFLGKPKAEGLINIGPGVDISIRELASLVSAKVGFRGSINWDHSKPDGMMRKCMNVDLMKVYGFKPIITLNEGIEEMITIYNQIKNSNQ